MQVRQRYVETLKTVGLFQSLEESDIAQIAELLEERRFGKGTVVFRQGEVGDALYIVQGGRCKASTFDQSNREKVLAIYGPGDFFGEMALISGQTRSATLSAVTDCTLLVLRKSAFESFLATNLQVMRQMLAVIAQRQAQTNVMVSQQDADEDTKAEGWIITVFSPKGGVGRTTVATNLAVALRQETGKAVALVDCSLLFGDVGVMLNFEPRTSIADLLPHINDLDAEILDSVLLSHASGIRVLLAPPSPEVAEIITGDHVKLILGKLREQYDYIVVDTLPHLNDVTLSLLDSADRIVVVSTLEMPALKNVKVFMEVTKVLGYPAEKIMLVVNRSDSTGGIRLRHVEETVGQKFAASVVSDGRTAIAATNRGIPIVMASRETQIAQDIIALAHKALPQNQLIDYVAAASAGRHRINLAETLMNLQAGLAQTFTRGQAAPKPAELLYGIGGASISSIFLLFLAALIGRIGEGLSGSANHALLNMMVNVFLWVSIVGMSYITARSRRRSKPGGSGPLGIALGVCFGLLVLMIQFALALANLTSAQVNFLLLPLLLVFYGALGFVGAFLAEVRRPSRLRSLALTH